MTVKIGDSVRDRVTGFVGVATARMTYISGPPRFLVEPPVGADGSWREARYFDEDRLELDGGGGIGFQPKKGA